MRTPILCYHKVGEPHDRSLNVSVRDFRRQVAFLARRYRLIPLRELHQADGRCVVLTFDDAYACSTEPLLQAAIDYDATGTVFPVTGFVGDASRWDRERARPLADWEALARLRDAGYEIGNHTHTHCDLSISPSPSASYSSPLAVVRDRKGSHGASTEAGEPDSVMPSLSKHDAADFQHLSLTTRSGEGQRPSAESREPGADEVMLRQAQHDGSSTPSPWRAAEGGGLGRGSMSAPEPDASPLEVVRHGSSDAVWGEIAWAEQELSERLGVRPATFAYPYGRYDERSLRAVRARGYVAAVTVRYGIASVRDDPHLVPRILISYSDGLPGLLYKLYIRPLLDSGR